MRELAPLPAPVVAFTNVKTATQLLRCFAIYEGNLDRWQGKLRDLLPTELERLLIRIPAILPHSYPLHHNLYDLILIHILT